MALGTYVKSVMLAGSSEVQFEGALKMINIVDCDANIALQGDVVVGLLFTWVCSGFAVSELQFGM